jgi:hypothetical protein
MNKYKMRYAGKVECHARRIITLGFLGVALTLGVATGGVVPSKNWMDSARSGLANIPAPEDTRKSMGSKNKIIKNDRILSAYSPPKVSINSIKKNS